MRLEEVLADTVQSNVEDNLDSAEKYLVCGMYEDAAAAAACALRDYQQKKSIPPATSTGVVLRDDHDTMREPVGDEDIEILRHCAGAVLVQAYHGLGRHKELQEELLTFFPSVCVIPNELFCMWISLLLTAGEFGLAGSALQEYLSSHNPTSRWHNSNAAFEEVPPVTQHSTAPPLPQTNPASPITSYGRGSISPSVPSPHESDSLAHSHSPDSSANGVAPPGSGRFSQWAALAEVYTILILTRGLQKPSAALEWLERRDHSLTPTDQERLTVMVRQEADRKESRRGPVSTSATAVMPRVSTSRDATGDTRVPWPPGATSACIRDEAKRLNESETGRVCDESAVALKGARPRVLGHTFVSEITEVEEEDEKPSESPSGSGLLSNTDSSASRNDDKIMKERQGNSLLTWLAQGHNFFQSGRSWHTREVLIRRQGADLFGSLVANRGRVGFLLLGLALLACILKGRRVVQGAWMKAMRAIRQALGDLWTLAFTINLNPLAAGQHTIGGGQPPTLRY